MKTKQLILTPDGKPQSIFIAVDSGSDKNGKKGFVVYGFSANQPAPTDLKSGNLLINTIFDTEDEALKAGETIVKAQVMATIARIKKEYAEQIKRNKRKK